MEGLSNSPSSLLSRQGLGAPVHLGGLGAQGGRARPLDQFLLWDPVGENQHQPQISRDTRRSKLLFLNVRIALATKAKGPLHAHQTPMLLCKSSPSSKNPEKRESKQTQSLAPHRGPASPSLTQQDKTCISWGNEGSELWPSLPQERGVPTCPAARGQGSSISYLPLL